MLRKCCQNEIYLQLISHYKKIRIRNAGQLGRIRSSCRGYYSRHSPFCGAVVVLDSLRYVGDSQSVQTKFSVSDQLVKDYAALLLREALTVGSYFDHLRDVGSDGFHLFCVTPHPNHLLERKLVDGDVGVILYLEHHGLVICYELR